LLKAGESFQATIQASRVGKNEAAITWSLLNPAKQPIAKGAVELGKSDRINVPAPAAGVYNLLLSTARNAAHLTLDNKHAVILGRDVALIHESGPLWFYVPPQTKGFKLNLESPAPGETARIAVCDPDGREVASAETGAKDKVSVSVSVSAGQDGKSWSVVPSRAPMGIMEDYTIALGDELPPYWAQAPDRLLVPAKWGRR
jgi:hypothetical protein